MKRFLPLYLLVALLPAAPAAGQIQVHSSLIETFDVAPGDVYRGVIQVANATDEPQQVRLYQTDYTFTADGRAAYDAPGTLPRSNAAWLRLPATTLTLPPRALVPVDYAVVVPEAGAAGPLRGTYWSVVMVESLPADRPLRSEGAPVVFRENIRYAVQVVTQVDGTGTLDVALSGVHVAADSLRHTLVLDLENTGERTMRPAVAVECFTPDGRPQGTFGVPPVWLHPGTSHRYRIPFDDLPAGTYRALVVIDAGDDHLFGAQLDLTLPAPDAVALSR